MQAFISYSASFALGAIIGCAFGIWFIKALAGQMKHEDKDAG
jgi:hypothetical protein